MSQIIANRYEILNTIGQGGMGDVFRGRDTQTGETVAIKLLKPDIVDSDPNLVERFTREGEALRRLNHPNIVNMLAAVEEDDLHYIVMQYVGGGSLRDLLDREPQLPVDRVLSIGIELADALTRAHHLKIIHRDLKPENVLLNDDGTPLLTDFGVARIGTRTRVTATGAVIGTYAYLSPEACMGEELDPRTDIWSFGVILYEMLAGRRPFVSDQATAILLQIINEPLPDLSGFRPDTPPALVELVTHMLHKDREERLPSVRLVGAALEAIMHGIDTPFPLTPSQILQKQVDRSRFATLTPTGQNAPDPEVTTSDVVIMPPTIPATPAAPGIAPKAVTRPAQSPERTGMRRWWPVLAGIGALAVIALVIAALLGAFGGKDETPPVQVAPVGPGEYMVLVAQLEPLRGVAERDISRFIVEDLTARLEKEIPFSNIRIRQYPAVITGPGTAQTVA
ncbi:MAG: serine/threonine protein kinase, partial [Anaerolineae bacterium]|nr:serine/threonine protein kinase [Anaerolineae bacterium]